MLRLAEHYLRKGKLEAARNQVNRILKLEPDHREALELSDYLERSIQGAPRDEYPLLCQTKPASPPSRTDQEMAGSESSRTSLCNLITTIYTFCRRYRRSGASGILDKNLVADGAEWIRQEHIRDFSLMSR